MHSETFRSMKLANIVAFASDMNVKMQYQVELMISTGMQVIIKTTEVDRGQRWLCQDRVEMRSFTFPDF